MLIFAHTDGTTYACNKRVAVDDTFGHGADDASPSVLQAMYDLEYEGAGTDIPTRTLHFLSNSAERHDVVEGILERSRRVEVFVSKAQAKDEVRDSMNTSSTRAYKDGKWKRPPATSPEEKVMGRDETILHVATEVAKAFGYDLESSKESSSSVPTGAARTTT